MAVWQDRRDVDTTLADIYLCIYMLIKGVHLSFIGRSDTYLDTCAMIRIRDDTFFIILTNHIAQNKLFLLTNVIALKKLIFFQIRMEME